MIRNYIEPRKASQNLNPKWRTVHSSLHKMKKMGKLYTKTKKKKRLVWSQSSSTGTLLLLPYPFQSEQYKNPTLSLFDCILSHLMDINWNKCSTTLEKFNLTFHIKGLHAYCFARKFIVGRTVYITEIIFGYKVDDM